MRITSDQWLNLLRLAQLSDSKNHARCTFLSACRASLTRSHLTVLASLSVAMRKYPLVAS